MFYKFKKGKQRELFVRAINIAGSERKLAKLSGIAKGSISSIKLEKRGLTEKQAKKICEFLKIELGCLGYEECLPDNWAQIKGEKKLIENKRRKGIMNETIERLKRVSSKRMKEWHNTMKETDLKNYHIKQYERFKKVGRGIDFRLIMV